MTRKATVRLIIVLVLTALPASAAPGPEALDFEVIPRELAHRRHVVLGMAGDYAGGTACAFVAINDHGPFAL